MHTFQPAFIEREGELGKKKKKFHVFFFFYFFFVFNIFFWSLAEALEGTDSV